MIAKERKFSVIRRKERDREREREGIEQSHGLESVQALMHQYLTI